MSGILFSRARDPESEGLRMRIFNAIPSATFQVQKLFQLLDVGFSDRTQSACIGMGARSAMLFNREFVETHCRTDEHLLMLVMHELYHLILGHTRLFSRATPALNIGFDAVINAMLCRQFPDPLYTSFFTSINDASAFPARLLRPPPGWPDMSALTALPSGERKVMELLYGEGTDGVTYHEVFVLLAQHLGDVMLGRVVLLGDHRDGEEACRDGVLTDILRRIVEGWPPPPFRIAGRDSGVPGRVDTLFGGPRPGVDFAASLRRLMRRAGVGQLARSRHRRICSTPVRRTASTVLPQARDRRVPALRSLLGVAPVYYRRQRESRRPRLTPRGVPHVYLDVSGSVAGELPQIVKALDGPHRRGECRCFVFSTVVDEIKPGRIVGNEVQNTGGTSIGCVWEHLFSLPRRIRPPDVLILTDGFVGPTEDRFGRRLLAGRPRVWAGILAGGSPGDLETVAYRIEELPPL